MTGYRAADRPVTRARVRERKLARSLTLPSHRPAEPSAGRVGDHYRVSRSSEELADRIITDAASLLSGAGVGSPRADAELLAAHVLGIPRGRLALARDFTPDQRDRFDRLVAARARRVPLQHLTGTAPFRYLQLAVGPGVFVPRPETELLAGWGIDVAKPGSRVVDLCSGSGAIALAVAHEAPKTRVYAVEHAPAALDWLRRNAEPYQPQVAVVAGDATDPAVLAELDGQVDVVLCNPPYVPDGSRVPPEVADHDPPEAVFGGADGLAVIRPLAQRAAALLRPGGWFGIEHDDSQGEAVPALLAVTGAFTCIADHRDLAGRPRFTTAQRRGGTLAPRDAV